MAVTAFNGVRCGKKPRAFSVGDLRGKRVPFHLRRTGLTLVEMLVVIGLIAIVTALTAPALQSIGVAGNFTAATHDIAGLLAQARTHAMAQNTHVFVGFAEVDAGRPPAANPQAPANGEIGGRVVVAAFSSRDGTLGYSLVDPQTSWESEYERGGRPGHNLVPIIKLRRFENVHLAALRPNPPSGPMQRESVSTNASFSYMLGDDRCRSVTPIAYPLGVSLNDGQYLFEKVIVFSPQGVARIQSATNGDEVKQHIEIGLQPTRGNQSPPLPKPNEGEQAAIQLDSMTGAVRIYRP